MPLINGLFKIIWLMVTLFSRHRTAILRGNSYAPDSYSSSAPYYRYTNAKRHERRLMEDEFKIDPKTYGLHAKLTAKQKKLKLLTIAKRILDKANKRGLSIDKVSVGSNVKTVFNNKNIVSDLSRYLNDKHLNKKIRKLRKGMKSRPVQKLSKTQKSQLDNLNSAISGSISDKPEGQGSGTTGYTQGTGRSNDFGPLTDRMLPGKNPVSSVTGIGKSSGQMSFSYLPGFGGPFGGMPPTMMGPVHMHPPVNLTVNRIPDPNPHARLNPLELQRANLREQTSELKGIHSKLLELDNNLDSLGQDVDLNLSDKVNKILQLGA